MGYFIINLDWQRLMLDFDIYRASAERDIVF